MKVSFFILVLALAAASPSFASPQRGRSSFAARRRALNEATVQEENAEPGPTSEVEQPEEPRRFKPSIRNTGSFRPKSSSPLTEAEPVALDAPSVAVADTTTRTPSQQPARSRSRGSKNFIESIKAGRASGLSEGQLSVLETTGILNQGSEARPSTRPQSGGVRLSSRPSSSRPPPRSSVSRASRPVSLKKEESIPAPIEVTTAAPKPTKGKNEAAEKRQRVLLLKNRNRASGGQKKAKMMEDMPTEEKPEADAQSDMIKEKLPEEKDMAEGPSKLDDQVDIPLEKAVKKIEVEEPMQMKTQEKLPALDEGTESVFGTTKEETAAAAEVQSSTAAPVTTTTEAASSGRRVSSITRLRSQRTRTSGASRNRASTPVRTSPGNDNPVSAPATPRTTTSSRGNRGRGGDAQPSTTRSRNGSFRPRVSSRNRASRPQPIETSEAPQEEPQAFIRTRRKLPPVSRRNLPSLSARFARVKARRRPIQGKTKSEKEASSSNQDTESLTDPAGSKVNFSNQPTQEDKKTIAEQMEEARASPPNRSLRGRRLDSTRRGRPINRNLFREKQKKRVTTTPRTTGPRRSPRPLNRTRRPIRFQTRSRPKPVEPSTEKPETDSSVITDKPLGITSVQTTTSSSDIESTNRSVGRISVVTSSSSVPDALEATEEESVLDSRIGTESSIIDSTTEIYIIQPEAVTLTSSATTEALSINPTPRTERIITQETTSAKQATSQAPTTTERIASPPTTTERITRPPTTTERITRPPTTAERITRPQTTTERITSPPTTTERITRPPTTTERITRPPTTTERITRPPTTAEKITRPPTTAERITSPPTTTERITSPPTTTERARIRPVATKERIRARPRTRTTTERIATTHPTTQTPTTRRPQGIKVAPEDPRDAVNRGGLKFRPHEDSERDIKRTRTGEVIITQIGTLENTPHEEARKILSGLGSRRRGLSRPSKKASVSTSSTTEAPPFPDINLDDYYYYDEYDYQL